MDSARRPEHDPAAASVTALRAEIGTRYPARPDQLPNFVSEDGRYRVRFARDVEDLERVLRLRFAVFNLELGEGLVESHITGLDRDRYDEHCHHLLVETIDEREVIGTYRLQTSDMAAAGIGFYSADEFDFDGMPADVLGDAVETGRACIHAEHRHRQVLLLLWKGLGTYCLQNRKRYLFGCCSITSQDPADGARAHRYLREHGHLDESLPLRARPGYECVAEAGSDEGYESIRLPKLFRTYLRYGAKICGDPVLDRQFRTIDFLALLDLHRLDPIAILRQFEIDLRQGR